MSVVDSTTLYVRDFVLGDWYVRPSLHRLDRGDEVIQIEPRSMEVLVDLAEHAGKVRTRRRLLHSVWGGAFVTDDVLTHAIWELRKALGDDSKDPRYIQTIPRKGYRLVASVTWEPPSEVSDERFPYRLGEQLGAGAMGVVYRGEDTRLRRAVALKFLTRDLSRDRSAKDRFLREARAAAKLDHPHIAVVHDVGESPDGRMYIAMAHYRGTTLKERLVGGPLPVEEAVELGRQMAEGLAAAHDRGIVHRDIKPANVMLTEDDQVKIVDFGLARGAGDTTLTTLGSTVGTALYMSPEQARGDEVDPRSDLWSLGVTLYEMVSGERPFRGGDIQAVLYAVLNEEPVKLSSVAPGLPPGLEAVVHRCLEKAAGERYQEASAAAEDLAALLGGRRPAVGVGAEVSPYPGLAPFTEETAAFFFGRDREVEDLWKKLERRKLLALIGPSGAGKTSFLRAGLVPARPEGWRCLVAKPGSAPFISLGQALAPELAGDPAALQELLRFHEPETASSMLSRWRHRFDEALLVIDQFEELFTLNPPQVQAAFAGLLGRLAGDADLHVLLSLRDDFLIHCHEHPPLAPVFDALLTPLTTLRDSALRQAIAEPAASLGYAFEKGTLVDEMVAEVEEERGALPLVAFTAARLWEQRDRENSILTRAAYDEIGGVGGALAQHADATLDQIGAERLPIVREIFRNLVTAQGTRAARDREEILSVFGAERFSVADTGAEGDRASAAEVIDQLIDARLLTSYEVPPAEGEENGHHRIEIIHESLLSNWPRLVRWQTQDADAAQLRDQLRQAARTWDEHDRSDDLLWAGSAYREFATWQENYPGGLSELEEAFARAMSSLAGRQRQNRRIMTVAVVAVAMLVAAVTAELWRRSVKETRRAEAANLVSIAQLEFESYPSGALAYALASLEQADSAAARQLALKALWTGPTAFVASAGNNWSCPFSPDGRWLVQEQFGGRLGLIGTDGTREELESVHAESPRVSIAMDLTSEAFTETRHFFTRDMRKLVLWSLSEGQARPLAEITNSDDLWEVAIDSHLQRLVILRVEDEQILVDALGFDGTYARLGRLDYGVRRDESNRWITLTRLDPRAGQRLGVVAENQIHVIDIGKQGLGQPLVLGSQEKHVIGSLDPAANANGARGIAWDPLGRFLATASEKGTIHLWGLDGTTPPVVLQGPPDITRIRIIDDGSLLEVTSQEEGELASWVWTLTEDSPRLLRRIELGSEKRLQRHAWGVLEHHRLVKLGPDNNLRVWTLGATDDAEPLVLKRGETRQANSFSFHPKGRWLATADATGLALWPFGMQYPHVIRRHEQTVNDLAFAPDGAWLVSAAEDGTVRKWPVTGDPPSSGSVLHESNARFSQVEVSPDGRLILVGSTGDGTRIISADGAGSRTLEGFSGQTWGVAFSPDGRLAAAAGGNFDNAERVIRVWDVASAEVVTVLQVGEKPVVWNLQFTSDGHLLSASESGLLRWDVASGEREVVYQGSVYTFSASADGRRVLMANLINPSDLLAGAEARFLDLDTGELTRLESHGTSLTSVATDSEGKIAVTGGTTGEVRVGPVTGDEPYLFLGHDNTLWAVAIDPLGRWIVSAGIDTTVRLWPMPDFSKPPLHTLPRDELIAKLKSLTNLRVVRDQESSTGWTLTHDPFPGWETVPTW